MTIAIIAGASVSTGQTGAGTTPAGDSTGANLIVSAINSAPAVGYVQGHDSKNADAGWANGSLRTLNGVSQYAALNHFLAPTVGTGHAFAGATLYGPAGVIAAAFSGVSSFDQTTGVSETASALSHPASSGTMTPSAAGALLVSFVAFSGDPGAVTAPTGMTLLSAHCGPSNNQGVYVAYEIQTGVVARTPVFTCTSSTASAGATKIFLATPGGSFTGGATLGAVVGGGSLASVASGFSGSATLGAVLAGGNLGANPGAFVLGPIKVSGIAQAGAALDYVRIYSDAGTLLYERTGGSLDGAGSTTLSTSAAPPGTAVRIDWQLSTGKRRMPRVTMG